MAEGPHKLPRLMDTPEWIFRWRGVSEPLFPLLLALVLVAVGFLLVGTTVRLKVRVPEKAVPQKASVIFLNDDAQGRALTLQAQEDGPFPSRFALKQWPGLAEMEAAVMAKSVDLAPPYVPQVPDLPAESELPPLRLAARGVAFFPPRSVLPAVHPLRENVRTTPVLYPLSGITPEALPRDLPVFDAVIDRSMAAATWRFLVRLEATGTVVECVSLEKGGEPGAAELVAWLQQVPFLPDSNKPLRWIAVGIRFINPPLDGSPAH
jgi:hypothetical protein